MRTLRVFVASPGDVGEERDRVALIIDELRKTVAPSVDIDLSLVRWETHAWPAVGNDIQDVLNREIGDYDVLVGIMWRRFGTASKSAKSGTEEEFDRAYTYFKQFRRPKIMFYFRKEKFYTPDLAEIAQFRRVLDFRKKLVSLGVLFWEYTKPLEFERQVREHLTRQLYDAQDKKTLSEPPKRLTAFFSYKRADLDRVQKIYDALRTARFSPWMDVHDILAGKQWIPEIKAVIPKTDVFLSFVSRHSVDPEARSETDFSVNSEIDIAKRSESERGPDALPPNSYIIPIRLDPVTPPPELSKYQWIDLFHDADVEHLISALIRISKQLGRDSD